MWTIISYACIFVFAPVSARSRCKCKCASGLRVKRAREWVGSNDVSVRQLDDCEQSTRHYNYCRMNNAGTVMATCQRPLFRYLGGGGALRLSPDSELDARSAFVSSIGSSSRKTDDSSATLHRCVVTIEAIGILRKQNRVSITSRQAVLLQYERWCFLFLAPAGTAVDRALVALLVSTL